MEKVKEKLLNAFEWIDKHNRHLVRNTWTLGNVLFYPYVIERYYSNPIGTAIYFLIQASTFCFLHFADNRLNKLANNYQSVLDNYFE